MSAKVAYNVTDIGENLAPLSLNNRGQVVLEYFPNMERARAILYDPQEDSLIDLGTLGGAYAVALSINDAGMIVGRSSVIAPRTYFTPTLATLFSTEDPGSNVSLGTLPDGGLFSEGICINNEGQIVGGALTASDEYHATLFDPTGNGENIDLGTLPGHRNSIVYATNNLGQAVGTSTRDAYWFSVGEATLFDMTGGGNNLGLGSLSGSNVSLAEGINDIGQIVGSSWDGRIHRATLFDASGGGNNMNLGGLGGYSSRAHAINNHGEIVGLADIVIDGIYLGYRAALFDPTGGGNNTNLNDLIDPELGILLWSAQDINDYGYIAASGTNLQGEDHAYLLSPIPEPATLIMLVSGMLFCQRRRR